MSAIRVFVVRPFAKKEGIDFERIDAELIQPALSRLAQIHDVDISGEARHRK